MKSMTGYGRCSKTYKNLEVTLEVTSLNKKNLEVSVSLPRDWQYQELALIKVAKEHVHRGKISINVKYKYLDSSSSFPWNEELMKSAVARIRDFSARENIEFRPTSDFFLGMMRLSENTQELIQDEKIFELLKESLEEGLKGLIHMREREGSILAEDMTERIGTLLGYTHEVEEKMTNSVSEYRKQLIQRLSNLGLEIDLSDERVLKELSLYADKCDITEEIVRLKSHLNQFTKEFSHGGAIGRKLDFFCQEINREFNTISNKSNDIEVTKLIIESKNELEKIREQVQNIE